jgi:hypothetical protein
MGRNLGGMWTAVGALACGTGYSLTKGWLFVMALMSFVPIWIVFFFAWAKINPSNKLSELLNNKSTGRFSSFKVIASFGMEEFEIKSFQNYVDLWANVRYNELKNQAVAHGLLFILVYCFYCWGFWIGSVFITHELYNSFYDRTYSF